MRVGIAKSNFLFEMLNIKCYSLSMTNIKMMSKLPNKSRCITPGGFGTVLNSIETTVGHATYVAYIVRLDSSDPNSDSPNSMYGASKLAPIEGWEVELDW